MTLRRLRSLITFAAHQILRIMTFQPSKPLSSRLPVWANAERYRQAPKSTYTSTDSGPDIGRDLPLRLHALLMLLLGPMPTHVLHMKGNCGCGERCKGSKHPITGRTFINHMAAQVRISRGNRCN